MTQKRDCTRLSIKRHNKIRKCVSPDNPINTECPQTKIIPGQHNGFKTIRFHTTENKRRNRGIRHIPIHPHDIVTRQTERQSHLANHLIRNTGHSRPCVKQERISSTIYGHADNRYTMRISVIQDRGDHSTIPRSRRSLK